MTTTESSGDVFRDLGVQSPAEALAESWASIDGKLDLFRGCRENPGLSSGYYEGYLSDAEEMIKRLARRGYMLAPTKLLVS